MKDEAMYQCKASNHLGSAYSTAQLKVLGKMQWCLIFMLLFMNRSFEYLHYFKVCINDMIYLLPPTQNWLLLSGRSPLNQKCTLQKGLALPLFVTQRQLQDQSLPGEKMTQLLAEVCVQDKLQMAEPSKEKVEKSVPLAPLNTMCIFENALHILCIMSVVLQKSLLFVIRKH